MARPANPNKEKITALKADIKDLNKTIRSGETAASKKEKLEARLSKLTGDEPVTKTAKAGKTEKTSKKKVDAKAEKKSGKVVTQAKKRGRPKKVLDEDDDD